MVTETARPEDEPAERIDTSPSTLGPTRVLWTHQQHAADYMHLMVEAWISLPMGEDQSVPLVTEVLPFFFLLLLLMSFCILLLVFL